MMKRASCAVVATLMATIAWAGDYAWLEYVQSTGTQYFDTGVPGRTSLSTKMRVSNVGSGSGLSFLGAAIESYTYSWGKGCYALDFFKPGQNMGTAYRFGSSTANLSWSTFPSGLLDFEGRLAQDSALFRLTRVGEDTPFLQSTASGKTIDTGLNIFAFARNSKANSESVAAPAGFVRAKCYSMEISQNDTLVRSFRPALRKSDSAVGLYDGVNGVFYSSASEDPFVAGPVVEGGYIAVSGDPQNYGRSSPSYGSTLVASGNVSFYQTTTNYEDGVSAVALGDGRRVTVVGCTVTPAGGASSSFTGSSFTYTMPQGVDDVAAVWNFGAEQYRVVVESDANGKVSVNGGAAATCVTNWFAAGTTVTVTPVPNSAQNIFIGWAGDFSGADNPHSFELTGPVFCSASFTSGGNVVQWIGSAGDGRWSTASNWSTGTEPGDGAEVSIAVGAVVTLDKRTAAIKSLALSGAGTQLVFDDGTWRAPSNLVAELRAETVTVSEGAVITHARNTMQVADYLADGEWKMNARVFISCSNLTVDATSAIDADGKGFYQTDVSNANYGGPGPGGGNVNASTARAAAGHGGYGSGTHLHDVSTPYVAGMTYGSFREPVWCGSAGDRGSSVSYLGFPGGGAVRIAATGTVTIEGRIGASSVAESGTDGGRYGGSGGSIWISAQTIVGEGVIAANGGTGASTTANNGYTGGGGRIAIEYNAAEMDKLASVPALTFSVDSPTLSGPWEASSVSAGDVGTLYFTDTRFIGTVFSATGTGVRNGEIHAGSWSGWAPASLTVNDVRLRFVEEGSLNVSIAGAVTLSGENARLYFGGDRNYAWSKYGGIVKYSSYAPRVTFGSLTLNSGSDFYLCPAATNGVVATDRQTQLTVTGKLAMKGTSPWGNGDTVLICDCHPSNGAAGKIVCGSCEIDSDNVIRSKGFGTDGSRDATAYGLGPGAATRGGAGHGGVGTTKTPDPGGGTYGSVAWPLLPGSTANGSGPAGGVVVLEVGGGLKVNGTISANSIASNVGDGCASSGGSVCITCETLSGSGTISALSANPSLTSSRDSRLSGGGGRVAIHYDTAAQATLETPSSVKIDVRGGTSSNWQDKPKFENADMGTVWLSDGTLLGNTLSTARGVQAGEIHLGDWSSWRPSPLTVDGVRVRLAPETALLELPGNVVISNTARLGFGGGTHALTNSVARLPYTKGQGPRVKIAGDVTLARGTTPSGLSPYFLTEFELLAGEATGSDATIGGELEIGGKLTVATNCCVRFTSHPLTGASCFLKVRELQLDNGGTIDAMGRGFTGTSGFAGPTGVGPGAGSAEAASGGHGGNGGAPTEETQGLAYDEYRAPLLPGSGGVGRTTNIDQWDSSTTSPVGAGGGVIRVDCRGTMSLAGTVTAAGDGGGSGLRGNGAGAGGSVFLRCKTWNPSDTLVVSADGGDHSSVNGYGGGGGRIAILRSVDNDPTPLAERLSVSAVAGASNGRSSVLPTDGTVHWGRWGDGLRVIVR